MLTISKALYVQFFGEARKNRETKRRILPKMEISDIRSILRLFHGSPFPRTISTYTTGGRQIPVNSVDEIYSRFREADFVDCRINAYPLT